MNIIDLRNQLLETPGGEKTNDRRGNPYPYGTQAWHDCINKNGLQLPAFNRRDQDRRETTGQDDLPEQPYVRILLTPAEKKLLEDVYLSELD